MSLKVYSDKTTPETQVLINEEFRKLSEQKALLPIKVTGFYQEKIDEEVAALGHTEGPLHRISYPSKEKIELKAPREVADDIDDRQNMILGIPNAAIRKYRDRILFMPTSYCAGNCQYCFRQDILSEQSNSVEQSVENKLSLLKQYLFEHQEVKEVILSGGDPMVLPYQKLKLIIQTLREETQVESIRIHTKTICYSPNVFHDQRKLELFAQANVRMVFHIAHPYEICEKVAQTIKMIRSHGIRCYNQFPLLRSINDHADLLIYHLKKLDDLEVRNLSIFGPEAIFYSAAFRISLKRFFSLMDEFNWRSPSWINSTRFVFDTSIGKVRRENLKSHDPEEGIAIFERDGKEILYRDFPEELDVPGDLKTMLWKGMV